MKDRMKQYYNAVCKGCGEPTHVPESYRGNFPLCEMCQAIHTPSIADQVATAVAHAHYPPKSTRMIAHLTLPLAVLLKE